MNSDSKLKFPLIELSDWLFEKENVFFEILENDINKIHYLEESRKQKHLKRIIIDSNGFLINIINPKFIKKNKLSFLSLFKPKNKAIFEFQNSGKKIDFDKLKQKILSKSNQIFHITHNKIMPESDFRKEIKQSESYENLISIATFLKYQ